MAKTRTEGRPSADRLGPEAWVKAAFAALVRSGADGVRVEPLARELGVTKGSFYWHFTDREALLEAIVTAWEDVATSNIIERVEAAGDDAKSRLRTLISITTSGRGDKLESAMRGWGATDERVGKVVMRVDARRETYVIGLFRQMGFDEPLASARTRILYLSLIGEYTRTAHRAKPSPQGVWDVLFEQVSRKD